MTKLVPIALLLIFILGTSQAQELTFEEYNPESTLVVPENPVTRAKFPVVDVHSHHNMVDKDLSVVVRAMDTLNLAVLVNLSGGSGEKMKDGIANIKKNYPNRFLQFANVDFSGGRGPRAGVTGLLPNSKKTTPMERRG